MDSLDGTSWDVLIAGTGIRQSLLALALSRSGKQVLHVDRNDYYGASEAALSLQEAEAWAERVSKDGWCSSFHRAKVMKPSESSHDPSGSKLGFSRAYSLSLAPDLLYTRSTLLPVLVSSRVHQQLEFQAVGSWFVFNSAEGSDGTRLVRVPNGREDVFADKTLNLRAKGALMKFLRFVGTYEEKLEMWQPHQDTPFPNFLSEQFNLPAASHGPLLALSLSPNTPESTTTGFALPRIARHLRSIGLFGPGFGAVIPKWGGLSEVAQVACRAGAVGGAVYVLGKGIKKIEQDSPNGLTEEEAEKRTIRVSLDEGEVVTTDYVVGSEDDLPTELPASTQNQAASTNAIITRNISIVSSPLMSLFPATSEGGPNPAGAMVVFPSGSLSSPDQSVPPVHIMVHASDTGECATGQCVLYATTALAGDAGFDLLNRAVLALLDIVGEDHAPTVLWSLHYEQRSTLSQRNAQEGVTSGRVMRFAGGDLDLALDDAVIDQVKEVWQKIVDPDAGEFMQFQDRQAAAEHDDDEE